jgi:hypothetical protein
MLVLHRTSVLAQRRLNLEASDLARMSQSRLSTSILYLSHSGLQFDPADLRMCSESLDQVIQNHFQVERFKPDSIRVGSDRSSSP